MINNEIMEIMKKVYIKPTIFIAVTELKASMMIVSGYGDMNARRSRFSSYEYFEEDEEM